MKTTGSFLLLIALCLALFIASGCGRNGTTADPGINETDAAPVTSVSDFSDAETETPAEEPADIPSEETPAETPAETPDESPAEPAEPETPPEPAAEVSPIYGHVAIIGVDGAGAFFKDADMPNLDRIFAEGAVTYKALTSDPTISAQSWGSLMTGVTPECHRLSNSYIESNPYPTDSIFPTFFRVVREAMPDAVLGSFCNWNPINVGIVENDIGVTKKTASDKPLTDMICEYVENEKPTVLFVQFDEVDGAGHSYGYGTKQHLKQLGVEDGNIERIYEAYENAGILGDTLFIVTADHGGKGTSHGGWTDAEKYIMWAAAGKTVQKGSEIEDMAIRDTASVVLKALGLEDRQPDTWTGRVPSGLFEGVTAKERPVYTVSYQYGHRTHETAETPAPSTVRDLFGSRVLAYLPFDGDGDPALSGKDVEAEKNGKLYWVDGYFGSAAQFDDGYVSLTGWEPGNASFSVCFWMKTGGVSSDPCLFSNKDWNSGKNKGFVLSLRDTDVKFNLGDGSNRMDKEHPLPIDYKDGWVYVILVVDREKNEIRFSYDFNPFEVTAIPGTLKKVSFDAYDTLNIGQDGTGKYGQRLAAVLDEFILIEGTLTDEDTAALKTRYGG